MQIFNNLVSRFRAAVSYRWKQITTNMPLRMKVGRFGIWLVKVGRTLQIRYANWNSEFRLEHEYFPNPDMCTLHVSEAVTDKMILTFESPDWQPKEMTPLVKALFNTKGVAKVLLRPYQVGITKARVFSWQELLPSVERVVLEHLA